MEIKFLAEDIWIGLNYLYKEQVCTSFPVILIWLKGTQHEVKKSFFLSPNKCISRTHNYDGLSVIEGYFSSMSSGIFFSFCLGDKVSTFFCFQ